MTHTLDPIEHVESPPPLPFPCSGVKVKGERSCVSPLPATTRPAYRSIPTLADKQSEGGTGLAPRHLPPTQGTTQQGGVDSYHVGSRLRPRAGSQVSRPRLTCPGTQAITSPAQGRTLTHIRAAPMSLAGGSTSTQSRAPSPLHDGKVAGLPSGAAAPKEQPPWGGPDNSFHRMEEAVSGTERHQRPARRTVTRPAKGSLATSRRRGHFPARPASRGGHTPSTPGAHLVAPAPPWKGGVHSHAGSPG